MKKIVDFVIITILLQSVFSVDPWRNVQRFFDDFNNSSNSSRSLLKENSSLLSLSDDSNEEFDNIISSLEKSRTQKTNAHFEKAPEIIKSRTSSTDTVNIYNNIVNIINNSPKY